MPRRASGPKLWFDKQRGTWTIIDGRSRRRTGFTHEQTGDAEKALRDYITSKHRVKDSPTPFIADVLAAYSTEHLAHKVSGHHALYDIKKLGKWWGDKRVSEISAKTCRAYAGHRKAPTAVRRELAFLNAALVHWNREHGPLTAMPAVTMTPKPPPRANWMTRSEAAQFLWHARKIPHLARFFIIGWYTGSRRSVIMGLKWSMINLDTGIMLRKERGAIQTSKRAPPVRMGARLMAHLRRWKRMDGNLEYVITYRGKRMLKPTDSWLRVRRKAKLPDYIIPHILRHSRATTMMRAGVNPWDAANALGMSLEVLTTVYGHHQPDWQKDAADAR
ncbi:MAG TPA: tyrosine-type recombinase/integrase [Xanthobacteraceae bacterium]